MTYKDYYKVLGVEKTTTPAEIKKAYRSLANKYHPDKAGGDKAAKEKFKDINEANEVLSDPVKRKKYDQFGADWKHYEEAGAQPGGFDWSKYASARGGQSREQAHKKPMRRLRTRASTICLRRCLVSEAVRGEEDEASPSKARIFETETTLSLEEAYHGTTRLIQLNGQTIKVTIKPGVTDNQMLRIAGKGGGGAGGRSERRPLSWCQNCTASGISPAWIRSSP